MMILELIVSFAIGIMLIVLAGWVFSLKTKGLFRLILNSVTGGIVLVALSLFKVLLLPLNPLNAFIAGLLGLPGLIVIIIIALFA